MMNPEIEREFSNVRRLFDADMAALRTLLEQRHDAAGEAMRVALIANEKRLDTMNEFRSALSDQSSHMLTRQEADAAGRLISERVEQNRQAFEVQLGEITKPKWTLMLSLLSIFLVVVGGVWALVGLKVDAAVAPVSVLALQTQVQTNLDNDRLRALEALTSNSTQADAGSRSDRGQLNDRVRTIETNFASGTAERRAQYAVMSAKLIEIETQFCSADIVRNLLHAYDLRVQSLLWSKVYPGERLPTDNTFFAHICNRQPTPE